MSSQELPKALGCHHITENRGYTCSQTGLSYRCGNCLRQDRDAAVSNAKAIIAHWEEALAQRDEARQLARGLYFSEIDPRYTERRDQNLPGWLTGENEEGE